MREFLVYLKMKLPGVSRAVQDRLGLEIVGGPVSYHEDGLTSVHNAEFIESPRFQSAYAAGGDLDPLPFEIRWRIHVLCWAGMQGMAVEGDFVECGVKFGRYARSIIDYTGFHRSGKSFWLLDTFSGLVEDLLLESEKARGITGGGYQECYDQVRRNFANDPNVKIIRGAVPETLGQVTADKIAFVSIDMNCVQPEVAAAEFFWDRMSPGAVMVLDDYGWKHHEEQKRGFDKFARRRGVEVLALPTGQGLIVKP